MTESERDADVRKRIARIFLALYMVSLVANLLFGLSVGYRQSIDQLDADEAEYIKLATGLASGDFVIDGRRTLGFPLFLSLVQQLTSSLAATQAVVSAFYSLSVSLIFVCVWRFTKSVNLSVLAALLLCIWPPSLFYGNSIYSESVAMPFFLLSLALLPAGSRVAVIFYPKSILWFFASGGALGLATHIRPMYLLFLPFMLLIVLFEETFRNGVARRLIATAIGFFIVILPWSFVLSAHLGKPALVAVSAGETLAGGINPELLKLDVRPEYTSSQRRTWVGPGKWVSSHETGYLSGRENSLPYQKLSSLLGQRARAWIWENPSQFAYIELRKLAYMWGIYPTLGNGTNQFLLGNIPILFLLIMSTYWLLATPLQALRHFRFMILPVFVSCTALISWGSWRFRQPGDIGLIVFCASAMIHVYRNRMRSAWNRLSGRALGQ
jgi:hypothetical protein